MLEAPGGPLSAKIEVVGCGLCRWNLLCPYGKLKKKSPEKEEAAKLERESCAFQVIRSRTALDSITHDCVKLEKIFF